MTNAPERIWIEDEFGDGDDDQWTYGTWDVRNYAGYDVEYVRADIVQALTAERDEAREYAAKIRIEAKAAEDARVSAVDERDRLREALGGFVAHYPTGINPDLDAACSAARAALKGETP